MEIIMVRCWTAWTKINKEEFPRLDKDNVVAHVVWTVTLVEVGTVRQISSFATFFYFLIWKSKLLLHDNFEKWKCKLEYSIGN